MAPMQPTLLQIGSFDGEGTLAAAAQAIGLKLTAVDDLDAALNTLSATRTEIVFCHCDLDLSQLFTKLNAAHISVPVVAVGPAQPVQNAVKAIRLGAIEYLSTPPDKDMVTSLLEKFKPVDESDGPVYGDSKTGELLTQAKQFAQSDATVLLRGESGTGKEVFSRFVHDHSPRKNGSFIAVNCAAIPENLLESELFGHEKGAFSGALQRRVGKFEQANGGTLLLDEISEMDLALQAKLLRAIQERVIDPVGSDKSIPVDIRLIATTNRKLEDYVAEGKFREDLYFRLNVVMLEIPPLRERVGDIEPLANYFAGIYGKQNGIEQVEISAEALKKLNGCYWKGNVRELENTIHRAVLMMGGSSTMLPEHIVISPMSLKMMEGDADEPVHPSPSHAQQNAAAVAQYASAGGGFSGGTGAGKANMVGRSLQEIEKELIIDTLNYCHGNRTHAADILGISIRTLRNKLKEYGAEDDVSPTKENQKTASSSAS